MDCATIFNLLAATSALSVVILQLFPFPVTPSAAISNLSIDTNASTTLSLVFFPEVLTSTLAPDTLAFTSLTRIVSAVALANLPLVIVTFSASIRQKSEKVQ